MQKKINGPRETAPSSGSDVRLQCSISIQLIGNITRPCVFYRNELHINNYCNLFVVMPCNRMLLIGSSNVSAKNSKRKRMVGAKKSTV